MNVLFDINHPAHVHFFKNFIDYLQSGGHPVTITARKKEITEELLDLYNYEYKTVSKIGSSRSALLYELIVHQLNLYKILKKNKIDLIFSIGGTFNVHIAKLMGIRSVVFTDTEGAKVSNMITFPFAYRICVPDCFYQDLSRFGNKVFKYNSYHELAYLHPEEFSPDESVLDQCSLKKNETFFVLRFVSWGASHDMGEKGISKNGKMKIVKLLNSYGRVIITSESPLPTEFEPYRIPVSSDKIHSLLSYCKLFVGEGFTMASESAALGTPAVLINSLQAGSIRELEEKYGLIYRFSNEEDAINKISDLMEEKDLERKWKDKNAEMLKDKINTTKWMIEFFETEFKG
ncbi:MAG: DUF354 domain-containing protein [Candidatus Delongbacteria bacterium]|jgi:predicted glycosyltransferase|nr:DUF354 domain-containing protein [Candidatus Delongbacteria bacterium]MDY0016712.1 DUF354 domain-containing protein [Candidatus Delongbacteria bacterium]